MKIVSSTLGMDASTVYKDVSKTEQRVRKGGNGSVGMAEGFRLSLPAVSAGVSRQAVRREQSNIEAISTVSAAGQAIDLAWSEQNTRGSGVSESMGGKVAVRDLTLPEMTDAFERMDVAYSDDNKRVLSSETGMQVSFAQQRTQYLFEQLNISTFGKVSTGDGREISLQLQLNMEREEISQQMVMAEIQTSRFIDPLVLSFSDGLAVLDDNRFSFDLDSDGKAEEISSLQSGSGFLFLDKDGDGGVSDGRELFGPISGNGYKELQIYDSDGNSWIDENDPVFDELQLWMGAGAEGGRLVTLREAGVGALSLASVDAHFNLKDRGGRIIGQVSRAGLFLTEDGNVRPLAELDLSSEEDIRESSGAGLSPGLQQAIDGLRGIIAQRRRRVQDLLSVQLRQKEDAEKQKDWLLRKLWELRQDRAQKA